MNKLEIDGGVAQKILSPIYDRKNIAQTNQINQAVEIWQQLLNSKK